MKKILIITLFFVTCNFVHAQWIQYNPGIASSFDKIYFINNQTGFAGSAFPTFHKTTNGGINWVQISGPLFDGYVLGLYFLDETTGFFATGLSRIARTTNGGYNWQYLESGAMEICNYTFINSNTGFAIGSAIYKTTNHGDNWMLITDSVYTLYDAMFVNQLTGYACGGYSNLIEKTTDGGNSWKRIATNLDSTGFARIFFVNANTGFLSGIKYNNQNRGALAKTSDAGLSWQRIGTDIVDYNYLSIHFSNANIGYFTSEQKIYKTTNGGTNFNVIYSRENGVLNDMKFFGADTAIVSGYYQNAFILKTTNGGNVFIEQTSTNIPKNFSLNQNYPNPFNPSTTISFQLPIAGFISLKVFDINGREVSQLVKENLNEGEYKINFNGAALPSGVYYYKLTVDNFSEVKKMVLVK
ncbi:MAG: T9SS type A sorting domain-containing protein [Bacteroidetes bacterium]|nr:T9SS type A sorting domain-containing protein [Bacteroidota bacterium]